MVVIPKYGAFTSAIQMDCISFSCISGQMLWLNSTHFYSSISHFKKSSKLFGRSFSKAPFSLVTLDLCIITDRFSSHVIDI